MFARILAAVLAASVLVAGCAKPPEKSAALSSYRPAPKAVSAPVQQTQALAMVADSMTTASIGPHAGGMGLAGRIIRVASNSDLVLRPREVILTFDDGPSPKVTPLILDALDAAGVKATFFMVGRMAAAHPQTAQLVALSGMTIGSHTHDHNNLEKLSETGAMAEVRSGAKAIGKAIAPVGGDVAPFFRFPYLAQTRLLRADLKDLGLTIFDVDVDSRDYKPDDSRTVLQRTLDRLDKKGGGIVLFHDIHMRTARLLPDFLVALKARGYTVVRVLPASNTLFDMPAAIASR